MKDAAFTLLVAAASLTALAIVAASYSRRAVSAINRWLDRWY